MKIWIQSCLTVLLSIISVYGQQSVQTSRAFTDSVKETSRRPAEIIKEPTVLGVGRTWAVVSWTTNAGGKKHSRIYAGTDPKDLKLADETPAKNVKGDRIPSYAEPEYSHLVRLNNLKPGTTYYFKAESGGKSNQGIESKSHTWTFRTVTGEPRSLAENTQLATTSLIRFRPQQTGSHASASLSRLAPQHHKPA